MVLFFNQDPLLLLLFLFHVARRRDLAAAAAAASSPPNNNSSSSNSSSNNVIKIGALLDLSGSGAGYGEGDSLALRCWDALHIALMNVNADPSLLSTTTLQLVAADSNCSAFAGAAAAMSLFQSGVVAIAGPQSSEVSHFVAHMSALTQVPLVSFGASDPSLSEFQYPYFVRLSWSDRLQMSAVADLIRHYGWREAVALYIGDDYGQNGVEALRDLLDASGAKLTFKASFGAATAGNQTISEVLSGLASMQCRVFVVHMPPSMARAVFLEARRLGMMSAGYAWIVTDCIAEALKLHDLDPEFRRAARGLLGIRMLVRSSPQLSSFLAQRNRETGRTDLRYHAYELLAYESIWMISYALDSFLRRGEASSLSFVNSSSPGLRDEDTDLARLKVLKDGDVLLSHVRATNFSSVAGFVSVDERGDAKGISFEIVNMVDLDHQLGWQVIGYWVNGTGCTSTPPPSMDDRRVVHMSTITNASSTDDDPVKLREVVWPGNSTQIPRGWVLPQNGIPLSIGVPNKTGYTEFVTTMVDAHGHTVFRGFCMDVFENATKLLPYAVKFKYVSFGNGSKTPNYNELIDRITTKEFDAVVGDVTITTARSKVVDFTQPFTTSGLVVVVPVKGDSASYAWAFMRPFTPAMWCTTGGFFLLTGLLIWMLEHKKNRQFRGRPQKQIVTTLWFIFSTLFFSHRENVKSTLGRAVLVIWLFVVLIITSSYTASLTSILTVEKLSPTIRGISGLVASDVPIGYQRGSFVEDYLLQLNVAKGRLVPLDTLASYDQALKRGPNNGGVGAIVDELPYVQLLLSSECAAFAIAGQEFTKSGWGFAFPKGSQLAIDMSTAILELSETGRLQQMHDKWLSNKACASEGPETTSNQLNLGSFWGLFLITGVTSVLCVICYLIRMVWEYNKRMSNAADPRPPSSRSVHGGSCNISHFRRGASFLKALASFIEEAELERGHHHENQYFGRASSGIASRDRSPIDSRRTSMSIRSIENDSARDSMVTADGTTKAELWQLVRDLSCTFKSNARLDQASKYEENDARMTDIPDHGYYSAADMNGHCIKEEGTSSTSAASVDMSIVLRESSTRAGGDVRSRIPQLVQRRPKAVKSTTMSDDQCGGGIFLAVRGGIGASQGAMERHTMGIDSAAGVPARSEEKAEINNARDDPFVHDEEEEDDENDDEEEDEDDDEEEDDGDDEDDDEEEDGDDDFDEYDDDEDNISIEFDSGACGRRVQEQDENVARSPGHCGHADQSTGLEAARRQGVHDSTSQEESAVDISQSHHQHADADADGADNRDGVYEDLGIGCTTIALFQRQDDDDSLPMDGISCETHIVSLSAHEVTSQACSPSSDEAVIVCEPHVSVAVSPDDVP